MSMCQCYLTFTNVVNNCSFFWCKIRTGENYDWCKIRTLWNTAIMNSKDTEKDINFFSQFWYRCMSFAHSRKVEPSLWTSEVYGLLHCLTIRYLHLSTFFWLSLTLFPNSDILWFLSFSFFRASEAVEPIPKACYNSQPLLLSKTRGVKSGTFFSPYLSSLWSLRLLHRLLLHLVNNSWSVWG